MQKIYAYNMFTNVLSNKYNVPYFGVHWQNNQKLKGCSHLDLRKHYDLDRTQKTYFHLTYITNISNGIVVANRSDIINGIAILNKIEKHCLCLINTLNTRR